MANSVNIPRTSAETMTDLHKILPKNCVIKILQYLKCKVSLKSHNLRIELPETIILYGVLAYIWFSETQNKILKSMSFKKPLHKAIKFLFVFKT